MKENFTRQEVINILVSTLLFSGANNNQGLAKISGKNFGEQAETIINANEKYYDTGKSIISVVAEFTK